MYENGQLRKGETLETVSPKGSAFLGRLLGEAAVSHYRAVNTDITGRAWTLARSEVLLDLDDPLVDVSDLEGVLDSGPAA